MNIKNITIANNTLKPPNCQTLLVIGIETNTQQSPPSAAKPIAPKFTIPLFPHWIFIPSDIIAEIIHKFKIANETFQLCRKPTSKSNMNINP